MAANYGRLTIGEYNVFVARDMVKKIWRSSLSQRFDSDRLASLSYRA
jgi:hypothetical protein